MIYFKPAPKTASDDLLPDSYETLSKIVPPSAIDEVVDLPKLQPTNVSPIQYIIEVTFIMLTVYPTTTKQC